MFALLWYSSASFHSSSACGRVTNIVLARRLLTTFVFGQQKWQAIWRNCWRKCSAHTHLCSVLFRCTEEPRYNVCYFRRSIVCSQIFLSFWLRLGQLPSRIFYRTNPNLPIRSEGRYCFQSERKLYKRSIGQHVFIDAQLSPRSLMVPLGHMDSVYCSKYYNRRNFRLWAHTVAADTGVWLCCILIQEPAGLFVLLPVCLYVCGVCAD